MIGNSNSFWDAVAIIIVPFMGAFLLSNAVEYAGSLLSYTVGGCRLPASSPPVVSLLPVRGQRYSVSFTLRMSLTKEMG